MVLCTPDGSATSLEIEAVLAISTRSQDRLRRSLSRRFSHCRQQRLRVGIVAKSLTQVDEPVHIARSKHEAGSQLKGILSQLMLPVAASFRPGTGLCVVRTQKMKKIRRLQFRRFVRFAVGIDEQGKSNAGCVTKFAGVVHVAQANGRQFSPSPREFALVLAQLRDMLAAENSTVVPQEHNDSGTRLP